MNSYSWALGVLVTAVLGYSVGYSSLYLFHLVSLIWLIFEFHRVYKDGLNPKSLIQSYWPLWILIIYVLISSLWVPNLYVWVRYCFYLTCGAIIVWAAISRHQKVEDLKITLKWLSFFLVFNFLFGFLESTTSFRLPISPYSEWCDLFGRHGADLPSLSVSRVRELLSHPTGFNWNPNNFVFVVLISLSFAVFHSNKLIKIIGVLIATWFVLRLGSRGHFLAYCSFFLFSLLFLKLNKKRILLGCAGLLVISCILFTVDGRGPSRILDLHEDLTKGVELIISGDIEKDDKNSLETRAQLYRFGIQELIRTNGVGLGWGGTEARLLQEDFEKKTFHFFYLQLLIDLGVYMFTFFIGCYLYLVSRLRQIYLKTSDSYLSYIAGSCSLALLVSVPGSIAPSSLHYNLTYYVLIGLSLSTLRLYGLSHKKESS